MEFLKKKLEVITPRCDYLDSSRGLAALSVLFSHFFGAYSISNTPSYLNNFIFHSLWNGAGAVYYFYILSGYVLSIGFFDKPISLENLNIGGFIIRRIFRIYPLFLVCLFISFVLHKFYLDCTILETYPLRSAWVCGLWTGSRTISDLFKESSLFILMPSASHMRLLPQDWTLNAEIWFSITIPIFILVMKRGITWFCVLFFFVFYLNTLAFPFCLGMLLARFAPYLMKLIGKWDQLAKCGLLLLGLFLYSGPLGILFFITKGHPSIAMFFESIGSAIFLLSLLSFVTLRKILSKSFLVFLGKISYGIYLTHFFILLGIIPRFINLMVYHFSIENEYVSQLFALLFLVVTTFGLSFLLHLLIEIPLNNLGKRISEKYLASV